MNMINVQHIYKRFGTKEVFHDFSMQVEEHEFVVIAGKSGSGKSTLLNMLGLLDKQDKGDIDLFDHRNIRPFSKAAEKILKFRIGYLFQNFALVEEKSVEYNLMMTLEHYKVKDKSETIRKALLSVGLEGYEKKLVYECSGGEQQRIAMARLLIKPCDLILADEPTGSLDIENKSKILSLLKKFQEDGKTVVVVTHDPDVMAISDRVIRLEGS